jgi:hypothetical protein
MVEMVYGWQDVSSVDSKEAEQEQKSELPIADGGSMVEMADDGFQVGLFVVGSLVVEISNGIPENSDSGEAAKPLCALRVARAWQHTPFCAPIIIPRFSFPFPLPSACLPVHLSISSIISNPHLFLCARAPVDVGCISIGLAYE